MKVKIFDESHEKDLEEQVNNYLYEHVVCNEMQDDCKNLQYYSIIFGD